MILIPSFPNSAPAPTDTKYHGHRFYPVQVALVICNLWNPWFVYLWAINWNKLQMAVEKNTRQINAFNVGYGINE